MPRSLDLLSVAAVICCCWAPPSAVSFSFPSVPNRVLIRSSNNRERARRTIREQLSASNGSSSEDGENDSIAENSRRSFLGLALPVGLALAANAPMLAVIAKPPTADEREEMLADWCKGDYCTLLQGGAGFADGGSASTLVGEAYDSDLVMPSLEEYEELARRDALAAEQRATGY